MQEKLPPTDSRLRPDQRYLENGEYEMANAEKLRLEQRQRQVILHFRIYKYQHFFCSCVLHLFHVINSHISTCKLLRVSLSFLQQCYLLVCCNWWNAALIGIQARKMQEQGWRPQWFAKDKGSDAYQYIGGYWEAREKGHWDSCPDIFGQVPCEPLLE